MRKIHKLIPAVALALAASEASAQLLYEPFNYDSGRVLDAFVGDANSNFSSSGTLWAKRGTQAGDFTTAAGLTGANNAGVLPPNMGGSAQYWVNPLHPANAAAGNVGRTPNVGFGQVVTSGEVYYSFQMQVPSGSFTDNTAVQTIAGFSNFAVPGPTSIGLHQAGLRLQRVSSSEYKIGIQTAGGTTNFVLNPDSTAKVFAPGETVFIVGRYSIDPTGTANDKLDLWVNPTGGFGGDATAIPTASVPQLTNNQDSVDAMTPPNPMIASFFMRTSNVTSGLRLDELRVDTTWAGVAPDGTKQYHYNNAGSGNWGDPNWNDYQGNLAAAPPNALGHVANFGSGIASGSTITVDGGGKTVDTINFANAGSLTIGGTDALTFSSNASAGQIYNYAGNHTINAPVTLASNLSIKTAAGTSVTLGGAVSGAGKTLGVYGNGTVKLGASNLIADDVRLEARSGTLDLNGNSETVNVLQLGTSHPNPAVAISTNPPTPYNGDLASGTISNGTITAGTYDLQSGTISASMGGTGGVTKSLAGFVTLSGNNSYTGDTVVNGGRLTLSGTNSNPVTAVINNALVANGSTSVLAISSDANMGAVPASPTTSLTINSLSERGSFLMTEDMTLHANRTVNLTSTSGRVAAVAGKVGVIAGKITGTGGFTAGDGTTANAGTVMLTNTTNDYAGKTNAFTGRLQALTPTVIPGWDQAGRVDVYSTGMLVASVGGAGEWTSAEIDTFRGVTNFNVSATPGTLGFDPSNAVGGTYTYASDVTGSINLAKVGTNTLVLSGNNSFIGNITGFSGTLHVSGNNSHLGGVNASGGLVILSGNNSYSGVTTADFNGTIRVTSNNALGQSGNTTSVDTFVRGGSAGHANSTLEIDGSAGDLTIPETFRIEGKSSGGAGNPTPHIRNVAGNNTITGEINFDAAGSNYNLRSDAGKLTVGNVNNATSGTAARILNLRGAGDGEIAGVMSTTGTSTGLYSVVKHDGGTWTLSGANTYNGATTVNAGTLRTTGAGTLGAPGGNVTNNATVQLYSNNTVGGVSGSGSTVIGDGVTGVNVEAKHVRQAALTVADGSLLKMTSDVTAAGASNVGTLTIGATGKLDLNSNKLVTSKPLGTFDGTAYGGIQGDIARAYNFGTWDGPGGLMTSQDLADPTSGPLGGTTTIAVNKASEVLFIGETDTGTFGGQTVTGATTLAVYTYAGDVNLDGLVDAADYGVIDNWVQFPGTDGYMNGDFNYDGVIDAADYGIIDNTVQLQGPPIPMNGAVAAAELSGVTAVPEPASLGVLVAAAAGLLGRRRRAAK